ncbi:hypothetical protein KFE25_009937 [Diacronema lutheri]|uniref:Uncharacterized protein n=1 Tax=Diacronema lutheri TaxID=2081491 RepID=A0A8J5XPY0_DIALT|nr:hypothetical protein KFE25_009937 [Diacronema lutheri]
MSRVTLSFLAALTGVEHVYGHAALRARTISQPLAGARRMVACAPRGLAHLSVLALADHSAKAAALFANVRLPASFFAGALMPLTFGFSLPSTNSSKLDSTLKHANVLVGVISLFAEIVAVVHATVAVNKLTEAGALPSESVLALLQRDYELAWLGTNVQFIIGLLGAAAMIGLRAVLAMGVSWATVPATLTVSAVLFMMSLVNEGIQDDAEDSFGRISFANNFPGLLLRYARLIIRHARLTGGGLLIVSLALGVLGVGLGVFQLARRGLADD